MKKISILMVCAVMILSLVGCGGGGSSQLSGSYANGSMEEYFYGETPMGMNYLTYSINTYENNTYEMTYTEVTDMHGVAAGTTTITTYGTYSKGTAADGFVEMTLEAPERMIFNSYSTLGGYAFDYDTDTDEEYILPGGDDVPMSKDEFTSLLGYNASRNVYIALDSSNNETCQIELNQE